MIAQSLVAGMLALYASTLFAANHDYALAAAAAESAIGLSDVNTSPGNDMAIEVALHTSVLSREESQVSEVVLVANRGCRCANGRRRNQNSARATNGLPGGRRYYNGRYFGNFNNRFYGPQYGYF